MVVLSARSKCAACGWDANGLLMGSLGHEELRSLRRATDFLREPNQSQCFAQKNDWLGIFLPFVHLPPYDGNRSVEDRKKTKTWK